MSAALRDAPQPTQPTPQFVTRTRKRHALTNTIVSVEQARTRFEYILFERVPELLATEDHIGTRPLPVVTTIQRLRAHLSQQFYALGRDPSSVDLFAVADVVLRDLTSWRVRDRNAVLYEWTMDEGRNKICHPVSLSDVDRWVIDECVQTIRAEQGMYRDQLNARTPSMQSVKTTVARH